MQCGGWTKREKDSDAVHGVNISGFIYGGERAKQVQAYLD